MYRVLKNPAVLGLSLCCAVLVTACGEATDYDFPYGTTVTMTPQSPLRTSDTVNLWQGTTSASMESMFTGSDHTFWVADGSANGFDVQVLATEAGKIYKYHTDDGEWDTETNAELDTHYLAVRIGGSSGSGKHESSHAEYLFYPGAVSPTVSFTSPTTETVTLYPVMTDDGLRYVNNFTSALEVTYTANISLPEPTVRRLDNPTVVAGSATHRGAVTMTASIHADHGKCVAQEADHGPTGSELELEAEVHVVDPMTLYDDSGTAVITPTGSHTFALVVAFRKKSHGTTSEACEEEEGGHHGGVSAAVVSGDDDHAAAATHDDDDDHAAATTHDDDGDDDHAAATTHDDDDDHAAAATHDDDDDDHAAAATHDDDDDDHAAAATHDDDDDDHATATSVASAVTGDDHGQGGSVAPHSESEDAHSSTVSIPFTSMVFPDLAVTVKLSNKRTGVSTTVILYATWSEALGFHYGNNIKLPALTSSSSSDSDDSGGSDEHGH